jgi:hypothetical protein
MALTTSTFKHFVIYYAVIFPLGAGFLYWPPIICGWEWFPHKKGLISGLTVAGFGFGAFFFGFITTAIVNPDDEDKVTEEDGRKLFYSKQVADRVPKMYHYCLLSWSLLALLAIGLISRNPEYRTRD